MKFFEIWYVDASQQTKNATTNFFLDFGLFWPFFNQKTAKIDKKLRKLAKSKLLMKFFKIWYVNVSQQTKNATKKLFVDFGLFWPFSTKKQPKKTNVPKSKPFDKIF